LDSAPPSRDIIVIGASSGGVETLMTVVAGLPADLPAVFFVVLHIPAWSKSRLPEILRRTGKLPASHPSDGEPIGRGHIYVAPPDLHLLLRDGRMRLVRGPRENNHRPAIDPLFWSAAMTYGPRVVGVVLSGALDDGSAGLVAVKAGGGIAIVQDPRDAMFPDMPRNALRAVEADYCLPKSEISSVLTRLASQPPVRADGLVSAQDGATNRR
jgi:two-component system chemotaxis response regulator CheB